MKFIAAITHRSCCDSDGKGWPTPSMAKEFDPETPIEKIWTWYKNECLGGDGLLEIIHLE